MPHTHWEIHRMTMQAMQRGHEYAHAGKRPKSEHAILARLQYLAGLRTERR